SPSRSGTAAIRPPPPSSNRSQSPRATTRSSPSTWRGQSASYVAKTKQRTPHPGEPVSDLLPPRPTLSAIRAVSADCKACDLYLRGTQTVFGEGPAKAEVMLVGE